MMMNLIECRACGIESEACEKCPVCGTETRSAVAMLSGLRDKLTNELTAFRTFAEFVAAMGGTPERQTYTPSIYAKGHNGRPDRKRQRLIGAVRAAGFKAFDGEKVA